MLNRAQLLGHVGQAPEIRSTQNGEKVATFSLATSDAWKDRNTGEAKERTEWHRIVCFGNLAGVVEQYVGKGSKLFIEGKIQTRKWQDQSGQDRYVTEVVLSGYGSTLKMLDGKKSGDTHEDTSQSFESAPDNLDDEIPF